MRALETQESSVDNRSIAGYRRHNGRRITAAFGVTVMFLSASGVCGQQGWSQPQSRGESSVFARPSSSREMLAQRLAQLRNAVPKNSETGSQQSEPVYVVPLSFAAQEDADADSRSDSDGSLQHTEGQSVIQPVSAETEAAGVSAVPELFLDLTQETQSSSGTAAVSKAAVHRNAEVSIGSSPTQVLLRAVAWIVIVLCVFSLTILGLRRWQRQRGLLPTTNSRSRVLETLSLGPGRTVSLIELAGFRALVASDTGGIRSLVLAPVAFHDELMQVDETSSPHVPATISP